MPKRNRAQAAGAALPELPSELWKMITKPLSQELASCACLRLLSKRHARAFEWEMLHAALKAEFAARKRKFEAQRERDSAGLEADDVMRLSHLSKLQGDLCGEARLHVFILGMVKECFGQLEGDVHPLRLALKALRNLKSV